jgi:hypothetical protein
MTTSVCVFVLCVCVCVCVCVCERERDMCERHMFVYDNVCVCVTEWPESPAGAAGWQSKGSSLAAIPVISSRHSKHEHIYGYSNSSRNGLNGGPPLGANKGSSCMWWCMDEMRQGDDSGSLPGG